MNKKKIIISIIIVVLLAFNFAAWKFWGLGFKKVSVEKLDIPKWKTEQSISNPNYSNYVDEYDIVRSTDALSGAAKKFYSKYIDYTAPNGKPIRLLAMDKVTDEQLLYAYDMLSFYLKSNDKIDKTTIANRMSETGTTLIIPNGADRDGKTPSRAMMLGQNLNQMEIANVGSKWYIDCDYEHRDASFEEIFHMVHDYGIGTMQNPGANPEISKIIAQGKNNALPANESDWGKKGLWGLNSASWLKELSKEGSLEQEYIVSVIDSYYGLWEPWTDGKGGMWGTYCAKNRNEITAKDPMGKAALESFLPENITQMMRIDPSFNGEFVMTRAEDKPYTAKSQYLQCVTLTGTNDSSISANALDNILMVNSGVNTIDGKSGHDIVQFHGASREYTVEQKNDVTLVTDSVKGRDGVNTLINIEVLRFTDKDM
ncbi:hypothetical protein SH2C18_19440 [Clostridium sediminicola]|uniref:hypothetical protein n=1 Tax=Clostridium sediminicola TaxID=3114879 RepID=UPI0031F1FF87